jgi:FkbM family methyltransferase
MKSLLRRLAQTFGVYEALGLVISKFQGWPKGIRVRRETNADFRVSHSDGRSILISNRHAIYLSDMVAYFDFYHGAVSPNEKNEVHYEKPAWHTLPRGGRPFYFTSYAESESTLDLYSGLAEIKPGDVILDVGACCGLTSLEFGRLVSASGHVYAFEADPHNFAALEKNVTKAEVKNVTIEHLAVWKESGELKFQADGTAGARVASVSARHDAMVTVKSTTLDDYIARRQISHIDLLKIDVEGSEAEILASSLTVLRHFRPTLIVELHPVHDIWTTEACQRILEAENYRTRVVSQPGTACPLMIATIDHDNMPR